MIEPLGLLHGEDAAEAVRLGLALPLPQGLAFTMARRDGQVVPATVLAAGLPMPPPWAGLPQRPLVMGIVNVTPDSFSNGGEQFATRDAVASGLAMAGQGAARDRHRRQERRFDPGGARQDDHWPVRRGDQG